MFLYICKKCIIYDLLLNCKYLTANMIIPTSDNTAIIMTKGSLKGRTKLFYNYHKSFHKNIREVFFYTCQHLRSYNNDGSCVVVFIMVGCSFFVDDLSLLMETSL